MRRPPAIFAALLSCCIAVLLALPLTASAAPNMTLGVDQFGNMENPQYTDKFQKIMRRDGATVERYIVRWDWVARCDPATRGSAADMNNPCYSWDFLDAIASKARANGLTMLFSIYGTPKWMFDGAENYTGTTDAQFQRFLAGYANFAQAVATRYDGRHGQVRVSQYTIWNEPNGSFMEPRKIDGKPVGPQRYAQMVNAAARRIKAVDPTMLVAAGPTAPHAPSFPPVTYVTQMLPYLQQLGAPIDAWAHNAYTGKQSPITNYTIKPPYVGLGNVDDLTALLDKYSVSKGKPLWITEFGYQTGGGQKAIEPAQQPALVADALYFAWKHPRIEAFIWYQLHDDPYTTKYSFMSALYYEKDRQCGGTLCPKPGAAMYRHTIWASTRNAKGVVTLWAQGRTAPAQTRLFVQRPGDGWRAYVNGDTARTGTVYVNMKLPVGTVVMTCDTVCGPRTTISKPVSGGGGVSVASKAKVKRLKAITLNRKLALRRGISLGVNCTKNCTVSGQLRASGRVLGRATGRRKAKQTTLHVRFSKAGRRVIARKARAQVTLRLTIRYKNGSRATYDRLIRLR